MTAITVVDLDLDLVRPSSDLVPFLEQVLGMARRGEIAAVAVAALGPDGCSWTSFSDQDYLQGMVGAVAILQHKIIQKTLE